MRQAEDDAMLAGHALGRLGEQWVAGPLMVRP